MSLENIFYRSKIRNYCHDVVSFVTYLEFCIFFIINSFRHYYFYYDLEHHYKKGGCDIFHSDKFKYYLNKDVVNKNTFMFHFRQNKITPLYNKIIG